jgi:transitional endoplasmic reticulum ATPase
MGNEEQIDHLGIGLNNIVRNDTYAELLRQRELLQLAIEEFQALESNAHVDASSAVELLVDEELSFVSSQDLACQDPKYVAWLRIVCLRVLVMTPALGKLKERFGYSLVKLSQFLGMPNLDDFAQAYPLWKVQQTLEQHLLKWESRTGRECRFPEVLNQNLDAITSLIGLSRLEREVLGLGVLIHAESCMDFLGEVIGGDLLGYAADRILAPMLRQKNEDVALALKREAKLNTTGLLRIDMNGRYMLRQLIDLLTDSFASRMLLPQKDIRLLLEGFVRPVSSAILSPNDFEHIEMDLQISLAVLSQAIRTHAHGVNILIYGKPGTGKTEFARMLASELSVQMIEISPNNLAGEAVTPMRRLHSFRIAQAFFCDQPTLLMFDECAEVLQQGPFALNEDNEAKAPRKSWINKMLESNQIPTIWISNTIEGLDEAYLRRFNVCFEMPMPSQQHRLKILEKAFQGAIGEQVRLKIAKSKYVFPALAEQTASMVMATGACHTERERESMAIHLINSKLKINGQPQINLQVRNGFDIEDFKPEWINTDVDLDSLRQSLKDSGSGRICLYGPPGTGKTAFGQWLACKLDREHMVVKASELISPFVGETEQKIAQAFHQAVQHGAVLQMDEVDSFLQERQKAAHQWEVTQVNEMLTQMESFNGIFIASTNLVDQLDEASLRRFDMTIQIDFMKPKAAWSMFLLTCEKIAISDVDPSLQLRLSRLRNLTPGDFEQVCRRSKLQSISTAFKALGYLETAVGLKKTATKATMGFLNAA